MKNKQENIKQYKLSSESKSGFVIHSIIELNQFSVLHEKPHRDDYFLLLFAFEGYFQFKIDFEDVFLEAPFILNIEPGQVHQIIKVSNPIGWVLGIEEFILESEFQIFLETKLALPIQLKGKNELINNIHVILKLAQQIRNSAVNVYNDKSILFLINSMLCLLIGEIETSLKEENSKENSKEKRGYIIEQSFKQLLKKNFKEWKKPSLYATSLSISVSHLNDTIKEITGISVSTHIQMRNVLEAKRLLYFTDFEIQEISYKLGYEDPVYFGKLFKKTTELSPLLFRKQFRD